MAPSRRISSVSRSVSETGKQRYLTAIDRCDLLYPVSGSYSQSRWADLPTQPCLDVARHPAAARAVASTQGAARVAQTVAARAWRRVAHKAGKVSAPLPRTVPQTTF